MPHIASRSGEAAFIASKARRSAASGVAVEIGVEQQRSSSARAKALHWRRCWRDRTSPCRSRHIPSRSATAARRHRGNWRAGDRDGRRRSAAAFAPPRARRPSASQRGRSRPLPCAGACQRARIVAQDMEHPEDGAGAGHVARHLAVAARTSAAQRPTLARTSSRHRSAHENASDHDARFVIEDCRRQAGGMGGARRHRLALARDMMERIVLADPGHRLPAAVLDDAEARIAQAAFQRLKGDRAMPAGQRSDAPFGSVAQANPPGRNASVGARQ